MSGRFIFTFPDKQIIIPNTVTDTGEKNFLKAIFQDAFTVVGGANFYLGLCDQIPAETDTLTDLSTEPAVANGYARKPLIRSNVGWPTVDDVNGVGRITSAQVTFTASGGPIGPFSRAFLCDVSAGTAGLLFAYSGALTSAITLADTETFDMQYEYFMD